MGKTASANVGRILLTMPGKIGLRQDARPRSARQETDAQIAQRVHSTWSLSSSVRWMNPLQPLPLPTGPDSRITDRAKCPPCG